MKTIIIEDEKPAAKRLMTLLQESDTNIEVLDVLDTIEDSVKWFQQNQAPDVIFMDIHLADGNSFEIFKKIKITSPVIFVTAYDEYALSAFKVNSVDYLLKPVKINELNNALKKLNTIFLNPESENIRTLIDNNDKKYKDRFVIKLGNKLITINTSQIAYFFSKDKVTFICDSNSKNYPIDLSLDKIETMLDGQIFFRINRQIIANYTAIKEIQTSHKSRLLITLHPLCSIEAQVSSERSAQFKKWLKKE